MSRQVNEDVVYVLGLDLEGILLYKLVLWKPSLALRQALQAHFPGCILFTEQGWLDDKLMSPVYPFSDVGLHRTELQSTECSDKLAALQRMIPKAKFFCPDHRRWALSDRPFQSRLPAELSGSDLCLETLFGARIGILGTAIAVPSAAVPNRSPAARRPNPNKTRDSACTSWNETEENACIRLVRKHHAVVRGIDNLFRKVSEEMIKLGFNRSHLAIKNAWNRRLRAQCKIDERLHKRPDRLVTGSNKPAKNPRSRPAATASDSVPTTDTGATDTVDSASGPS